MYGLTKCTDLLYHLNGAIAANILFQRHCWHQEQKNVDFLREGKSAQGDEYIWKNIY